jgi:antitoxin component of MazEF toxin-antitoxin module
MKDKISNRKRRQHVRTIFKLGNNGKTSSYVVTIPKYFLETLDLENNNDNKVIVSLENENDHFFVKIIKLDGKFAVKNISENKIKERKTVTDLQDFENWD